MDNGSNDQTTNSPFLLEGITLTRDLIDYKLGRNVPPANATAKTLRKLSDDIEIRNPDLLEQLCSKLRFSNETGYSSFSEIAKEVFSDGTINWGRIAVLFAFGARLGKYCCDKNMSEQLDNIPEWVGKFVLTDLSDWIENQGGWVRTCLILCHSCEEFPEVFFYLLIIVFSINLKSIIIFSHRNTILWTKWH